MNEVRCVSKETGKVKYFPQSIANDPALMERINYEIQELNPLPLEEKPLSEPSTPIEEKTKGLSAVKKNQIISEIRKAKNEAEVNALIEGIEDEKILQAATNKIGSLKTNEQ